MLTKSTTRQSKWDHMAEALFVDYPRRLREDRVHGLQAPGCNSVTLSESIVVNGNQFIPANTTLIIDEPVGQR